MARRGRRMAVAAVLLAACAGTASAANLKGVNGEALLQAKTNALGNAAQQLRAKVPSKLSFQVPTLKAGSKKVQLPAGVPSLKVEPQSKTVSVPNPSVEIGKMELSLPKANMQVNKVPLMIPKAKIDFGKMTVSVPVAQLKWNTKTVQVPTGLKFDVSVPVKDMQLPTLDLAKQNVDLAVKFGDVATVDLKKASMDQLAATLGQLQASADAVNGSARAKMCNTQAADGVLSKVTFGAVGKACAALELEQAKVNAGIALVKQALDAKAKAFASIKGSVSGIKGGAAGAAAPAATGASCACPRVMSPVCSGKGVKYNNECLARCAGAKVIKACDA